jgi:hypothetical protein
MDDPNATPEAPLETPQGPGKARVRLGAVLAVAIAAGIGAWAVVGSRDSDSSPEPSASTTATTTPTAVRPIAPVGLSAKGLRTLTASIPEPIYWAGPKPGYLYELTRTSAGKIFIRYLPSGTKVGTKRATYLIVATYPFRDALKALTDLSGKKQVKIPGGGVAIVDDSHPESVHLAFPGVDNQIEVYDPSPARSLAVAKSGAVRPVTP